MNLLEVKGLCKDYKNFSLQDISFSLPKGYIMGYVGQNGAGKTTTINCINHICHANAGEIRIDGKTYDENIREYKETIAFIGDESYFPKEMKVPDIRKIVQSFYHGFHKDEFDALIQKFQIPSDRKISEFSRGMKVKLMFAVALSRDTKLLVLDEATNGLDPVMRADVLALLQDYIADGEKSILFSTHMLEDLEQIADYIVLIHGGKLLLNQSKDELIESYILVRGEREKLTDDLKKLMYGMTFQEYGFEALIQTDDVHLLPKGWVMDKPSIDQIMVHLIRDHKEGQ